MRKNNDVIIRENEVEIKPVNIIVKYDKEGNCEIIVNQKGNVKLKTPKDLCLETGGDFLLTCHGEVGILSKNFINMDSSEIHLNSRNCKQIRDLEKEIKDIKKYLSTKNAKSS